MKRSDGVTAGEPVPRYRTLISEWAPFVAACRREPPTAVRVNTLRADPQSVIHRLRQAGLAVNPYPWSQTVLRLDTSVGRRIEHWLGLIYVQEMTQTLPALVLDPQPDERILDMCAAPGGKTTQIAALMRNRGRLVANEPSGRRQPSLLSNINRMGVLNALVTAYRGESFPSTAQFDRILVDAPCSGEGTLRKDASAWGGAHASVIRRLSRIQEHLIVRAFDLLRPGGRLVYSTCTFAPEENEAIVAHLLRERDAIVHPISLPFPAAPGVTDWEGRSFPAEVVGCARIYPHHLDSGGGFIAHVERTT